MRKELEALTTKTADRRHAVEIERHTYYISNPATRGNDKLNCLNFSLAPIVSCPGAKKAGCAGNQCYAVAAYRLRPTVRAKQNAHFLMAKAKDERLFNLIENQIKNALRRNKEGFDYRIHTAGDFFNQWYLNRWVETIRKFPSVRFFAFTKSRGILDFSEAIALPNLSLIDSLCGGAGLNFGHIDDMREIQKELGGVICPDTDHTKCGVSCRYCYEKDGNAWKYALFEAHGAAAKSWANKNRRFISIKAE